jgi:hypothetical protein
VSDEHDHGEHHADPTFYRSPRDAAAAPAEQLAYVAAFARPADKPDAIAVVDVDPASASYSSVVGFTELPNLGDELHHFGWNACSSALCPGGGHDHGGRQYLIVPGLRSSRLYVLDIKDDPAAPKIVKVLEADELGKRAGYSRPHTVRCGPGGLFVSCLGGDGQEGPGGVALLDHNSFEVIGQWEADRGDQYLAYDVWWHINQDVAITSEWGTPSMIENGIVPELLLGRKWRRRSRVGVHPPWLDQHGGAPLRRHYPVVGVPVVMGAARGGEHGAEQPRHLPGSQAGQRVTGAGQFGRALGGRPFPAGPDHDGHLRPGPQVGQLPAAAPGDQSDRRPAGHRVSKHPGVHHRGLDGAVRAQRGDDAKAVIASNQASEIREIGHGSRPLAGIRCLHHYRSAQSG